MYCVNKAIRFTIELCTALLFHFHWMPLTQFLSIVLYNTLATNNLQSFLHCSYFKTVFIILRWSYARSGSDQSISCKSFLSFCSSCRTFEFTMSAVLECFKYIKWVNKEDTILVVALCFHEYKTAPLIRAFDWQLYTIIGLI